MRMPPAPTAPRAQSDRGGVPRDPTARCRRAEAQLDQARRVSSNSPRSPRAVVVATKSASTLISRRPRQHTRTRHRYGDRERPRRELCAPARSGSRRLSRRRPHLESGAARRTRVPPPYCGAQLERVRLYTDPGLGARRPVASNKLRAHAMSGKRAGRPAPLPPALGWGSPRLPPCRARKSATISIRTRVEALKRAPTATSQANLAPHTLINEDLLLTTARAFAFAFRRACGVLMMSIASALPRDRAAAARRDYLFSCCPVSQFRVRAQAAISLGAIRPYRRRRRARPSFKRRAPACARPPNSWGA